MRRGCSAKLKIFVSLAGEGVMSVPTRARRSVGRRWLGGRRRARPGGADTPTGGTEGGMEVLCGGHGQHSAPATLDRNWDGGFKGSPQQLGELAMVGQAHREGTGMPPQLSPGLEKEIRRLIGRGHGKRAVARMVGCSKHAGLNALGREPRPTLSAWHPSPAR